jgi:hypothetical protein
MTSEIAFGFISWHHIMLATAPVLILITVYLHCRRMPSERIVKAPKDKGVIACAEAEDSRRNANKTVELPDHHHLQGCFIPDTGEMIVSPNKENRAQCYENDMCVGSTITLHRATWDAALNKSGDYPNGDVFQGRSINWEVRVQMRLKRTPDGTLKFGIELDDYVPLMVPTKAAMKVVVAALKLIVGEDLHHSTGDDPAHTVGEAERPIFSMPMWAFDQFIETPEGEEPPSLTDPNFMNLGMTRSHDAFARTMRNLEFRPGPTYTLSFWSISKHIDNINWTIGGVIPGMNVDFNRFCGRPPVHVSIYTLRPPADGNSAESRHLDSRKCYLFHIAFWSSQFAPPAWRLQQLLPEQFPNGIDAAPGKILDSPKSSANSTPASRSLGLQGAAHRVAKGPPKTQGAFSSCFAGLHPSSCFPRRAV